MAKLRPVTVFLLCRASRKRWSKVFSYPTDLNLDALIDSIRRNQCIVGRMVLVHRKDGGLEVFSADPWEPAFVIYA